MKIKVASQSVLGMVPSADVYLEGRVRFLWPSYRPLCLAVNPQYVWRLIVLEGSHERFCPGVDWRIHFAFPQHIPDYVTDFVSHHCLNKMSPSSDSGSVDQINTGVPKHSSWTTT